jgi:predicted small secreted protein
VFLALAGLAALLSGCTTVQSPLFCNTMSGMA